MLTTSRKEKPSSINNMHGGFMEKITNIEADSIILKNGCGIAAQSEKCDDASSNFLHETVYNSDYGKNIDGILEKPKGTIQRIVERYENAKIKPYIGAVDLNKNDDDLYEIKPNVAYEIGIKIDF